MDIKKISLLFITITMLSVVGLFSEVADKETALPGGMKIKKGSVYETYTNGNLKDFILAEDWLNPAFSWIFKGNTAVKFYENGDLESFTLAKDWKDPYDGKTFKADSEISFYTNKRFQKFTLSEDWKDPDDGMILKGGAEVLFYDNGVSKKVTLAENWTDTDGKILKGGTDVSWDTDYHIRLFVLGKNWKSFAEGAKIFMTKDGSPKIYNPKTDSFK